MADLSSALLAFAGGAAKEFNKQEDEKRAKARKIEERRVALADQAKATLQQTQAAKAHEDWLTKKRHNEQVTAMGGVNNPKAQIWYNKSLGFSDKQIAEMSRKGMLGNVPMHELGEAPLKNFSVSFEGKEPTQSDVVMKRMGEKAEKYNRPLPPAIGGDIPEGVSAHDLLDEGSTWTPKVLQNGTVVYVNEDPNVAPVVMNKPKEEVKPTTQLTRLMAERSNLESAIAQGKAAGQDTTTLERDLRDVQLGIEKARDKTGQTEVDVADKTVRRSNVKKIRVADSVVKAADELAKFSDATLHGVGGVATNIQGFFRDQYESITGAGFDVNKGFEPTTLASHMAADFEGGRAAQTALEARMAQGAEAVYETILKYKAAKMLKPEGKLNVDDLERADRMLGVGITGGAGYAKAANVLKNWAESEARNSVASIIFDDPDVKNFTGEVRKVDGQWYYKTNDKKNPYLRYQL